ncbi:MAG: Nif3-like dinuclear metal center hexameric protein [Bacteroidota bacterium]
MKRIKLLLALLFLSLPGYAQDEVLTAGEVVDRIKQAVTTEWADQTVDTFKSGSEESVVTGIATTFLSNLDVLKRAKAKGCNMVITHEPTFYNHLDKTEQFGENDPVLTAKQKFIKENGMIIWRFHDHWHRTTPDGIYKGMEEVLGWTDYKKGDSYIYEVPETTLSHFASDLKEVFQAKSIRVIGPPDMKLRVVGLKVGSPGSMAQIEMLRQEEVEVLVGGESLEWETVEYVRDAISAGMNKAMILLGHAHSEEAGMEYCAEWLKGFVSEVPIEFVPAYEPFWSPE